jgi:hypothetical protein
MYRIGTWNLFKLGMTWDGHSQCLRPRWDQRMERDGTLLKKICTTDWYKMSEQQFDNRSVLDGQITDAQKGDVRVGLLRRQKMSKEKICGGLL